MANTASVKNPTRSAVNPGGTRSSVLLSGIVPHPIANPSKDPQATVWGVYRAILLDVYGTLVRDDEDWADEVCAHVASVAGVSPPAVVAEWQRRLYASAEVAHGARFRTLADLTLGSLAETASHFGVRLRPERPWVAPPLFDDSLPFLDAVSVPVCLVSDADRDELEAVLAFHRISVAAVVTSEEARAYKPRPEPFRLALARLGLGPGDVVHIGDSASSDVAGAAALGIDTAFLDRTGAGPVTATYTAASLTALLPQLRLAGP